MSDHLIMSDEIIKFGKFKSRNINEIIKEYPSYCQWMMSRPEYLNKTQIQLIKHSIRDDEIYLTFGKYKNRPLSWVFNNDQMYINYLLNNQFIKDKMVGLIEEIYKLQKK